MQLPIDLRSDTVTRPTPGMRAAMAAAEVGDDVFGEDPTVRRLKTRIAEMLGKEAALFVPSGTMGNQLGVRVHCQPGDEFLCEANCHILCYEQGAYAQFFGIAAQPVEGEHGVLQRRATDGPHPARATITACARGWCAWRTRTTAARAACSRTTTSRKSAAGRPRTGWRGISTARGCSTPSSPAAFRPPIGPATSTRSASASRRGSARRSARRLCGPADLIRQARRHRKALGGGMRQAGIIAAGALYALEHHIDRLAEDHANARILADAVRATPGLKLDPDIVDTNIVIFEVDPELGTAAAFCARLRDEGVLDECDRPAADPRGDASRRVARAGRNTRRRHGCLQDNGCRSATASV